MSKMSYAHYVITRFNIPANYAGRKNTSMNAVDPKTDVKYLNRRIDLFKKYTFPSLKNQTNQNFKWLVLFSDQTPECIREKLDDLKVEFANFCPQFLTDEEAYHFDDFLATVIGQEEVEAYITTRIDNDDAMNIHMIEGVQSYFEKNQKTNVLVSYPYGLQYMESRRLFSNFNIVGNHFISLILSGPDKSVISFPHNSIPKEIQTVKLGGSKEPMWIEIIHGSNYANQQSFHIGKAVKSRSVLQGFHCEIKELNTFDVVRNVLVSIPETMRLVIRMFRK